MSSLEKFSTYISWISSE